MNFLVKRCNRLSKNRLAQTITVTCKRIVTDSYIKHGTEFLSTLSLARSHTHTHSYIHNYNINRRINQKSLNMYIYQMNQNIFGDGGSKKMRKQKYKKDYIYRYKI